MDRVNDDLLLPEFLSTMFAELNRRPAIGGLIARKRRLDERGASAAKKASPLFMAGYRLWVESYFLGRASRRISASNMFWITVGNLVGLICRRDAALALGGFQPNDEMSGDYWFFTRLRCALHCINIIPNWC